MPEDAAEANSMSGSGEGGGSQGAVTLAVQSVDRRRRHRLNHPPADVPLHPGGGGARLAAPTGKDLGPVRGADRAPRLRPDLAQLLNCWRGYDGNTGAYLPNRRARRRVDYLTVIIDECSMLTEEQPAALIDTFTWSVERLVLVGDSR